MFGESLDNVACPAYNKSSKRLPSKDGWPIANVSTWLSLWLNQATITCGSDGRLLFMYLISSLSASKIKKTMIKDIKSTNTTPFHKGVANHPPGLPFATSTGYHNLSNIATWFAMGFWSYPDIDILHNSVYNKSSKRLPSKTAGPIQYDSWLSFWLNQATITWWSDGRLLFYVFDQLFERFQNQKNSD